MFIFFVRSTLIVYRF